MSLRSILGTSSSLKSPHSKFILLFFPMLLLITGAAGFIGARTAQMALDAGHEDVGLDNLNDY